MTFEFETFWHTSHGGLYFSRDANPVPRSLEQYKDQMRRAYGSLRGIKYGVIVDGQYKPLN